MEMKWDKIQSVAKRLGYGSLALFTLLFFMSSNVYAQPAPAPLVFSPEDTQTFLQNTWAFKPSCSLGDSSAPAGGAAPTIALDPGHSGNDNRVNDVTGLLDHDYPNQPEMDDVFTIATDVQKQLIKDGYNVVMTKKAASDTVSLRDRATIANNANAALAVSIHDDSGQNWSNFAQIYTQQDQLYRDGSKGRVYFNKPATADLSQVSLLSQKYGKIFQNDRSQIEGHAVDLTNANFDNRGPDINPGNIPQVELYAKVPWVYNEVGASPLSGGHLDSKYMDAYTRGLIKSIEESVPVTSTTGAAPTSSGNITSPGSIVMQTVDTTQFHPDPKALNYFNQTSLPLLKPFVNAYVTAAQAEGVPQNWEILPALHGPELSFGLSFKPNGVTGSSGIGAAGGPSGPYQETAFEMKDYLSDSNYGPVLQTLITPAGAAIPSDHINESQLITLSRLAYHRWVSQALGSNYDKLKSGPIPFNPSTASDNFLSQVMARWNSSDPVEGFNGYNTGANAYNPSKSVWPGMATTYYMLKNWEASGGMKTISIIGGSSNDCGGTTGNGPGGGSANCAAAPSGSAKIICEALLWKGSYYLWGGGHGGGFDSFVKGCPDPSKAAQGSTGGNPGPCGVDCSGLVSMAVDFAFGQKYDWLVDESAGHMTDGGAVWKSVPLNQVQPGDIGTRPGHVEIIQSYTVGSSQITTFGAHYPGAQDSTVTLDTSYWSSGFWHYTGPGGK